MLGLLFGWRKASKCKKLVNLLRCRLKLLKSKRYVIVRQLREDIAQLLKNGQYERALALAEQLFKEQGLLEAYDLLANYSEFIIIRFPYIRRYKDCPEDINEGISTLIFATSWCGDLPELPVIRKLFGERYGSKFTKAAAELHSGNVVNHEIREKLCVKSITDDVKLKLIIEIAKEYIFSPRQLGCDNTSKVHLLQFRENNKDHHLEGFIFKEEACDSFNNTVSNAKHSQSVLSFVSEPAKQIQAECSPSSSLESCGSDKLSRASSEEKEDPAIVYLEEVKELEINALQVQDHCSSLDKRIFLFNSCIHPLRKQVATAASSIMMAHRDQQSEGIAKSSCGYVHPKLPDYDELTIKFKALKKQHLQRKNRYKRQVLYFLANDRFC